MSRSYVNNSIISLITAIKALEAAFDRNDLPLSAFNSGRATLQAELHELIALSHRVAPNDFPLRIAAEQHLLQAVISYAAV